MSSSVCPRTCSHLSTAAVLIVVGVIQFLAGILLLKSEYGELVAGTDFIAASSNVFVGCSLGISASIWEKKKKWMSAKSTARQNVLAGLYISVMAVNATAAIIMIMGDGNKLLTATAEVTAHLSASFVVEILACAYVTSVCSPIICIVIALVCLSGNRIQVQDTMKYRDSIAKSESYGWVFQKNSNCRPKTLSEVLQNAPILNSSSVAEDSVFVDKSSITGDMYASKNETSKMSTTINSLPSAKETQSPLEIWAHKRKKILEELTSPKQYFFNEEYLQFPDFSYGSYVETMIPRIKQSSLVQKSDRNQSRTEEQSLGSSNNKVDRPGLRNVQSVHSRMEPNFVDSSNSLLLEERVSKLSGIKTKAKRAPLVEGYQQLPQDEVDSPSEFIPHPIQSHMNEPGVTFQSHFENLHNIEFAKTKQLVLECRKKSECKSPDKSETSLNASSSVRANTQDSETSTKVCAGDPLDLKSEMLKELKTKMSVKNIDSKSTYKERREFLLSFKGTDKPKSVHPGGKESDANHEPEIHPDDAVSKTSWLGEVVPISIRTSAIKRNNSIPVRSEGSSASSNSVLTKGASFDGFLDVPLCEHDNNMPHLYISGEDFQHHKTSKTLVEDASCKNIVKSPRPAHFSRSNGKLNVAQKVSSMGSIDEAPYEEMDHVNEDNHSPDFQDSGYGSERTLNAEDGSTHSNLNLKSSADRDRTPSKSCYLKSRPSISAKVLKKIRSFAGSDGKADLTNLIMDSDSLVGLSNEELLARTHRLRQLRKSVEMRSRNTMKRSNPVIEEDKEEE